MASASGPEAPPRVPAARLMATLPIAGAIAGLAIVLTFRWAEPRIEAHRAEVLRAAIHEVLGGPKTILPLYVAGGRLVASPPAGTDTAALDRVYAGFDASGRPLGYAVAGEAPGYQDVVRLLFGYDPGTRKLLGMKVLESNETPGLGNRITEDSAFIAGFAGVTPPLEGVRPGEEKGDEHEVDMISGATISSRTVVGIINARLEVLRPLLDASWPPPGGAGGKGP